MTLIRKIVTVYFSIGAVLASVMYASYVLPFGLSLSGMLVVQPIAIFSSAVRFVTWGPSIATWIATPSSYSFGKWIAPGLWAETRDPNADPIWYVVKYTSPDGRTGEISFKSIIIFNTDECNKSIARGHGKKLLDHRKIKQPELSSLTYASGRCVQSKADPIGPAG